MNLLFEERFVLIEGTEKKGATESKPKSPRPPLPRPQSKKEKWEKNKK